MKNDLTKTRNDNCKNKTKTTRTILITKLRLDTTKFYKSIPDNDAKNLLVIPASIWFIDDVFTGIALRDGLQN